MEGPVVPSEKALGSLETFVQHRSTGERTGSYQTHPEARLGLQWYFLRRCLDPSNPPQSHLLRKYLELGIGKRCHTGLSQASWPFTRAPFLPLAQVVDESGQSCRCDVCDGKGVALQAATGSLSLFGIFWGEAWLLNWKGFLGQFDPVGASYSQQIDTQNYHKSSKIT